MSEGSSPDLKDTFFKGVANSVWQGSGGTDEDSNWTRYAYGTWPFKAFGIGTTKGKHKIGKSCDFWNRYKEDIELAHKVGSTSFRFSFEWARLEPTRGVIDLAAVKRFNEILDALEARGMEPNVTLHHFTHPQWFEELGGFEKEENIPIFVEYAKKAFELFGSRIRLWATFNEPTCYSFLGWCVAMGPPGWIGNCTGSGRVILNILKSHTAAYNAMKAMPGGSAAQIGLVHHHITFKARGTSPLYWVAGWFAKWTQYLWGWDVIDHWMLTGEFVWKLPFVGECIRYKDPAGKPPCDWWGINYYSRVVLDWHLGTTCFPGEVMTEMYYPIYPEGLYQCLKRGSEYGIPMYITETGIADSKDTLRGTMIDSYMKAVLRAVGDGYDVRGIYYWTLVDNFEWATGFTMRFGLYRWEADGSVDRVMREGAKVLARYFKTWPDSIKALRRVAAIAEGAAAPSDAVKPESDYVVGGKDAKEPLLSPAI